MTRGAGSALGVLLMTSACTVTRRHRAQRARQPGAAGEEGAAGGGQHRGHRDRLRQRHASELPPELRDTPLGREFRRRFNNRRQQVAGAGSGFIIDASGIIVTNNHVVGHADKIVVSLTDGRQLPATVLGHDELTDVAVIKIEGGAALPVGVLG